MRIRNHKNKNEYINANNMWVRNFTKKKILPVDINNTTQPKDQKPLLLNEFINTKEKRINISNRRVYHPHIIIASDGLGFEEKQHIISEIPTAAVLGVTRTLKKWKLMNADWPENKRREMYYVVNNPYIECMSYFPKHTYFPNCIASLKTYPDFLSKYSGPVYHYTPTPEQNYHVNNTRQVEYTIDDYRNPICAAIGLAYQFGVRKLALFCCDDAFSDERPAAIKTEKETWIYPQHLISHSLIDTNLYWLKSQEEIDVEIVDHSSGPYYTNAVYIETVEELVDFFKNG